MKWDGPGRCERGFGDTAGTTPFAKKGDLRLRQYRHLEQAAVGAVTGGSAMVAALVWRRFQPA